MCVRERLSILILSIHITEIRKKIYIYTWDREADSETVCIAVYESMDGQDEADISFGGLRPCVRKNITIISISPLCCSGNPNTKKNPEKKLKSWSNFCRNAVQIIPCWLTLHWADVMNIKLRFIGPGRYETEDIHVNTDYRKKLFFVAGGLINL